MNKKSDNLEITPNNLEINDNDKDNINFFEYKSYTPYCPSSYNLLNNKSENKDIVAFNENMNINDYCKL
jgi:hypothetical protein